VREKGKKLYHHKVMYEYKAQLDIYEQVERML